MKFVSNSGVDEASVLRMTVHPTPLRHADFHAAVSTSFDVCKDQVRGGYRVPGSLPVHTLTVLFYEVCSRGRESITFVWNSLTGFRRRQNRRLLICISNCFGIGPCFPITLLKTSQALSAVSSLNIFVAGWILHAIHLFQF